MKSLNTKTEYSNSRTFFILLILIALSCPLPIVAQPLTVQVFMPPNPSPYLSDWIQRAESRMIITVVNPASQVRSIYFTGVVQGDNGVSAQTKQGFKPAKSLQIPPNATMTFTGPQLKGMFEWEQINSSGVDVAQIERSGMLPEGAYTLCVDVKNYQTGELYTNIQPSACSPSFTVKFPQPPIPTSPTCNAPLQITQGQPVMFSWLPSANTPQNVLYRLRIVEVMPNQNPNEAMQSAPPVVDQTVTGNSFQLNPTRLVTPSKFQNMRFAWTVAATDPSKKTTFSNNGLSEVCTFEYNNAVPDAPNAFQGLGAKIKIEIGRPSKYCYSYGFCKIALVDEDTPKSAVPDSRLMPKKPKVYASVYTSNDNQLASITVSSADVRKYQPDKLKFFEGRTFVTFEEDNPLSPVFAIIIKAGDYPLAKTEDGYQIFFDLNPDPKVKRPGDYGDLDDEPCRGKSETTAVWRRTGYCYVDEMAHKECGEIKDRDKLIKKLEEFVEEHGKDWGKELLGSATKASDIIKSVVTIYKSYDFYVHVVRDYCDREVTYKCVDGKWVSTGGKIITAATEDLGWVKLMVPSGDASLCWLGNESIGDLRTAIDNALAIVCGGSPTIVK